MFLSSGCVLNTFLTTYIADSNRPRSHKNMTFLVQAGTFLCFQAGRSSTTRFFGIRSYCNGQCYYVSLRGYYFNSTLVGGYYWKQYLHRKVHFSIVPTLRPWPDLLEDRKDLEFSKSSILKRKKDRSNKESGAERTWTEYHSLKSHPSIHLTIRNSTISSEKRYLSRLYERLGRIVHVVVGDQSGQFLPFPAGENVSKTSLSKFLFGCEEKLFGKIRSQLEAASSLLTHTEPSRVALA